MGGWLGAILWAVGFAAYGGTESMECELDGTTVFADGTLRQLGEWTTWRIEKCKGQKPALRVSSETETRLVYQSQKTKLSVLGFLDASRPARKLEDIGTTWRISQGMHGYDRPVWVLREGKHTLVFVDMLQSPLSVVGALKSDCGGQVDIDPAPNGFVITLRDEQSGEAKQTLEWPRP